MIVLKKIGIVTAAILIVIITLLLVFNLVLRIVYRDFYKNADRAFKIPGIGSGFVPQGFEDTDDGLLISGYMKKEGEPSRIYLMKDEKNAQAIDLYYKDGTPYTGHAGGIDLWHDFVYLTGDKTTEVFDLGDLTDGDGKATVLGEFDPGLDPAWCTVVGDYILMGSFANSKAGDYPPDPDECMTTPAGDRNVSLIFVFKLNDRMHLGISPTPVAAISSGEKIQGLTFLSDSSLVLSTSYGLKSSWLIFHAIDTERVGRYQIEGGTVPLIYLDSATETKRVKAPPMSEELIVKDGYLFVMNESACNKYFFGKLIGQRWVYKYKL